MPAAGTDLRRKDDVMSTRELTTRYTVSEITRSIKDHLEAQFSFIAVSGEISNFHRHSSGHLYFSLKDQDATLSAVMFRGNAMGMFFRPDNGMEVICRGSLTVYPPRGNYQLVVTDMVPLGEGALQVAFERLKRKLHEEGLFDEHRKRPLPRNPRRVGLVTSPTGAALRDMVSVIRRRNPSVELVLVPTQVQGAGAAEQIVEAIGACNAFGALDVLIVGRGGGSIEDLWAFNEEIVARAIAASRIPVVSAVGHEVDVTIADYAADLRAATPSVAGEIVVPSRSDLLDELRLISDTLWKFVDSSARNARERLRAAMADRAFDRPMERVQRLTQRIDERSDTLNRAVDYMMERSRSRFEILRHQTLAHDPGRIQHRGYAIVRKDGRILRSVADIREDDRVTLSFHDGDASSVIESIP
jgi:exodeoxyribonuclease VII large subunit